MNYENFIENKVIVAEDYGFKTELNQLSTILLPHQKDIVKRYYKHE